MSDQELYNKFRPDSFSEIKGQEHITKLLQQYLKAGTIPHSLIFFGPPGTGKTTSARIMAKSLNPHNAGMIEVNSAVSGKVDDMRALDRDISHYPMEGESKTYIFDEAHRISSAGFDSLLKTVEEPPSHVKFIFVTTNLDAIPSTIRSRSDLHTFNRIPNLVVRERLQEIQTLEGVKLSTELIDLAVEAGSGSLRNAIVALQKIMVMYSNNETQVDIVKSLGIVGPKGLSEFCMAYIRNDVVALHKSSNCFDPTVVDPVRAIHSLQQFLLDARLCLLDADYLKVSESNVEFFLSGLDQSSKELKEYNIQCLLYIFDMSLLLEADMSKTTNLKSLINRFVIKLADSRA